MPVCRTLSDREMADLVIRHFPRGVTSPTDGRTTPGEDIREVAFAVACGESELYTCAYNPAYNCWGLWQFCLVYHPEYTSEQMCDPDQVAVATLEHSGGGNNWYSMWEAYRAYTRSNYYANYMARARRALGERLVWVQPLEQIIAYCSGMHGVSPDLATLIIASEYGAAGKANFYDPTTGRTGLMAIKCCEAIGNCGQPGAVPTRDELLVPQVNVCWGCKILRDCLNTANGDAGVALWYYAKRNDWYLPTELIDLVLEVV